MKNKRSVFYKLFRGVKEMAVFKPSGVPLEIISGIVHAAKPFVNIYLTAKIVGELLGAKNTETLVLYSVLTVALNFILYFSSRVTETLGVGNYKTLYVRERHAVDDVLLSIDYTRLEDPAFETLVRKYRESCEMKGSHLAFLSFIFFEIVRGLVTFGISVFILLPLFKISFKDYGIGFVGSPYFLMTIFLSSFALVFAIYFLTKKINRTLMRTDEEILQISKILNYYIDLITEYRNGKEIRLYGEQRLIENDATKSLLTDGVRVRKKAAQRLGAASSYVAVIGAVIGFGVYVFVGLKALAGMFDVSSLLLYMGSFMMIMQSLITIFSAIGSTINVTKTIGYYFDIVDELKKQPKKKSFKYPKGPRKSNSKASPSPTPAPT